MLSVTFDELEATLRDCGASVDAAEAHGALCGALAAVGGLQATDWIADVLAEKDDEPRDPGAEEVLTVLFAETEAALAQGQMEFLPLLPDDEVRLEARVAGLAAWCTGFLYGIGTGGIDSESPLPDAVSEVARDFGEISRATIEGADAEGSGDDSDEADYAELFEYLRASAQLVYDELATHRGARGGS